MSEVKGKLAGGPYVMIISDGWGYNPRPEEDEYNAVKRADPAVDKMLMSEYPNCLIHTSGEDVGLPDGTMGNSEVGHQNIGAGSSHSLALKSDGSIVGWGYNYYNQATPLVGTDYVAISAGDLHSFALKTDGSIVGWGGDKYGEVTSLEGTNFIAVAGGWAHSLAIRKVCGYWLVGDVNRDYRFDMSDFAIMAENWQIDCDVEPLNEACEPK